MPSFFMQDIKDPNAKVFSVLKQIVLSLLLLLSYGPGLLLYLK